MRGKLSGSVSAPFSLLLLKTFSLRGVHGNSAQDWREFSFFPRDPRGHIVYRTPFPLPLRGGAGRGVKPGTSGGTEGWSFITRMRLLRYVFILPTTTQQESSTVQARKSMYTVLYIRPAGARGPRPPSPLQSTTSLAKLTAAQAARHPPRRGRCWHQPRRAPGRASRRTRRTRRCTS